MAQAELPAARERPPDPGGLSPSAESAFAAAPAPTTPPGEGRGPLRPVRRATGGLTALYRGCNPDLQFDPALNPRRALTKLTEPRGNGGCDNADADLILHVSDVLKGPDAGAAEYEVLDLLGQGTFGQVFRCQNVATRELVAVKVIKNRPAYLNQALVEVRVARLLNKEFDPDDSQRIVRLHGCFQCKNHLCLVFELLGLNLYELVKQNQFRGLSLPTVRRFVRQTLTALSVLRRAGVIHCDLKPENVLLAGEREQAVKLIDFGSACFDGETVATYVQSRFYRSPEVVLGLPYTASIDMWSLGCIAAELFLGIPLFPGSSEHNLLARVVGMLGPLPARMLAEARHTLKFFNVTREGAPTSLKTPEQFAAEQGKPVDANKQYFAQRLLRDIVLAYPSRRQGPDAEQEQTRRLAFVDFCEGLLRLDPAERWTPAQALAHPFITGEPFAGAFDPPRAPAGRRPVPAMAASAPVAAAYSAPQQWAMPPPPPWDPAAAAAVAYYNAFQAQMLAYAAGAGAQQRSAAGLQPVRAFAQPPLPMAAAAPPVPVPVPLPAPVPPPVAVPGGGHSFTVGDASPLLASGAWQPHARPQVAAPPSPPVAAGAAGPGPEDADWNPFLGELEDELLEETGGARASWQPPASPARGSASPRSPRSPRERSPQQQGGERRRRGSRGGRRRSNSAPNDRRSPGDRDQPPPRRSPGDHRRSRLAADPTVDVGSSRRRRGSRGGERWSLSPTAAGAPVVGGPVVGGRQRSSSADQRRRPSSASGGRSPSPAVLRPPSPAPPSAAVPAAAVRPVVVGSSGVGVGVGSRRAGSSGSGSGSSGGGGGVGTE